jgi:hypothetical protein
MDSKILDFIEGMYSRKLTDKEIIVLKEMLNSETIDTFKEKYAFVLGKKIEYFTPAKMQQLINERKEIEDWKARTGIKDLNELYEN